MADNCRYFLAANQKNLLKSVFCCLGIVVICVFAATSYADGLPNIVVILVDDMGYGDPQCYNRESRIRTPNIDSIAANGMKFTDAHAAGPLCHMSRYGLITGVYPFRTNVALWPKQPLIRDNQITLPSMLRQRGYETAMVGKWHLGFRENGYDQVLPGGPVDVGFDSFFGIRASTDIPPYFYIRGNHAVQPPTVNIAAGQSDEWSPIQGAFWRSGLIAPDMTLDQVLPRFTEEAIEVIKSKQRSNNKISSPSPLFLYLAYPSPHTPWLPSEEFAGKSRVGMYGDFCEMVDAMVGRVLSALDDTGMSENTLVIFSSDNGPVWYPEDNTRWQHDASGGWRGMKGDAWEAGHRVPFIVRWPGRVARGATSDQLVGFTDVLATLAAITDTELPANTELDSIDFSAALKIRQHDQTPNGESKSMRDSLALSSGSGLMTYRQGDWKLIEGLGSGGFSTSEKSDAGPSDPKVQLYNLRDDPAESRNLAAEQPDQVQRLTKMLDMVRSR